METSATSFARETVEIMNDTRTFGHSFAYVRAAIELPADAAFGGAVRVAPGDAYAAGTRQTTTNDDARCHMFPVAVTASVPASMRWPSVAEARVCEDAQEVVDRAARDARARGGRRGDAAAASRGAKRRENARVDRVPYAEAAPAAAPPRNPLMIAADPVAAAAGEDEAFVDDELMSSSEDEGPEGGGGGGGGGAGIRRRRRRRRRRRTGVAIEIRPGRANAQSRHAVAFAPPDAGEGVRVPCVHAR